MPTSSAMIRVTPRQSDKTLTGNNWKAGLVYAITPDTSVYGQYATSTDGVGGLISLSPGLQQFDLSTARQTEIGLKQAFWDQRGEWTVAASNGPSVNRARSSSPRTAPFN